MPEKKPDIEWDRMSKSQQQSTAIGLARKSMFRLILLSLIALSAGAQPLWQAYFKNEDQIRNSEIVKFSKESESALALSKVAISEVSLLSSKMGELKLENENLRKSLADLTEKYQEMEKAYSSTLEEKKKLEERIDELFKNKK